MVQYSWSARLALCVVRNVENLMKFSKGRSAACVTEKKSVGEKDHLNGLRGGQRSWRGRVVGERLLEKPRSSGYVRVRLVRIDMFSSSTAARRPTEVSIIVTLVVRTLKFGRIFPEKEASEEDSYRFSKTEIKR